MAKNFAKISLVSLIVLFITGCSQGYRIDRPNFHADVYEGFWRSYVYTEIVKGGLPVSGSGKLTICNGYIGLLTDTMRNATVLGGAALLGVSFPETKVTSSSSQSQGQDQSQQQSQSNTQNQHQDQYIQGYPSKKH